MKKNPHKQINKYNAKKKQKNKKKELSQTKKKQNKNVQSEK